MRVLATGGTGFVGSHLMDALVAFTTCAPFRRRLACLGFLRAPRLQTFVLHNFGGHPDEALLSETSHWYLTFTDSDGDMWSGTQPPARV